MFTINDPKITPDRTRISACRPELDSPDAPRLAYCIGDHQA
jgi:hypothetical protein